MCRFRGDYVAPERWVGDGIQSLGHQGMHAYCSGVGTDDGLD